MLKKLLAVAASLATMSLASTADAKNYSLWIHGYDYFSGCGSTPSGWCYWGGAQPGVNAVPVNYNSSSARASASLSTVVSYLNSYCTGSNACYIAAHSAGGMMIGYAESVYPKAWNIIWVDAGGSAAGGSELANAADWASSSSTLNALGTQFILDLTTSQARAAYNHDALGDYITGHVYTFMGGDWSSFDTCFFPGGGTLCGGGGGGNDRVVAYHSSGHFRSPGSYGTASATPTKGGPYWDYTSTQYVDDQFWGTETHFSIMADYVAPDMSTYAK